MKKTFTLNMIAFLLAICFSTLFTSCSITPKQNGKDINFADSDTSAIELQTTDSDENAITEFIPAELFAKTTTIVAELEVLCNDNGIPLKLNHKEDRKNELEGWVSDYTVADRENQFFYVIYDKESYISTVTITFTDSGNDADFYKFQKMMYYTLQIQELHIPIDETNQVIQKFNSEPASKFWQLDTNNRSYTYMLDTDTGFETFSIRYNY